MKYEYIKVSRLPIKDSSQAQNDSFFSENLDKIVNTLAKNLPLLTVAVLI